MKGTTYAKAAKYLEKTLKISSVEDTSLGGLLIRLDAGDIDFAILDKPVAEPWVKNRYKIAEELRKLPRQGDTANGELLASSWARYSAGGSPASAS